MNTIFKTSRNVLLSKAFLLNFLIILLVTSWVPLLSQTVEMRDSEGNIMHQQTNSFRLYESWWIVVRWAPGARSHIRAVALHVSLCFAISFGVWFIRIHTLRESEGCEEEDEAAGTPDDNESDREA